MDSVQQDLKALHVKLQQTCVRPCLNDGVCHDEVEGYTRVNVGSGIRCETNVDDCVNVDCQNGGTVTCQDHINYYECQCPQGILRA